MGTRSLGYAPGKRQKPRLPSGVLPALAAWWLGLLAGASPQPTPTTPSARCQPPQTASPRAQQERALALKLGDALGCAMLSSRRCLGGTARVSARAAGIKSRRSNRVWGVKEGGESPPSMGPPTKVQVPASAVRVQTAKCNWLRTFPETKIALAKGRGASGWLSLTAEAQPPSCPRFHCHLRARPLGYLHQRCTGRGIILWPLRGPPPEAGGW